jgi:hypothetical protein
MAETAESLQERLIKVRSRLDTIELQLADDATPEDWRTDIQKEKLLLLEKEKRIEEKLERTLTATTLPTPAPAPPGNSITPPQVLPLASFLLPLFLQNSLSSTNYN